MNLADSAVAKDLAGLASERPTFVLVNEPMEQVKWFAQYPAAHLDATFPKPGGRSWIEIWEIKTY